MTVVKLGAEHTELIKPLFAYSKFMGVDTSNNYFVSD